MSDVKLSKIDEALYAILQLAKLECNKTGELNHQNISGVAIKIMRQMAKVKKISGETKRLNVGNVMLLICKEFGVQGVELLSETDIDSLVQDLFDTNVIVNKKCC
jgi:hypothetical protein